MTNATPVLFTHFGDDWIRGSETLLLDLLGALNPRVIQPIVWCNAPTMEDAVRRAGFLVYRSDFQFFFDYGSPRVSLVQYRQMLSTGRDLCRRHSIKVLHANSAAPVQWLVPLSRSHRIPLLAHLHTEYLRRSRYVLLLHAASLVVGVSQVVVEGLIKDGMASARTRVIYNGIGSRRIAQSPDDLRAALNIPRESFVVATAGSLIARKGHDVLLRAFAALPAEPAPPHLLIASDGPEREALEDLARASGISNRVHFLGHLDDVAQLYQAADAFALATRGDAFGLVLAEAGSFGLPVVSTRVGGIPEVVIDEATGLLTAPDDVPATAHALCRLMEDAALRTRLGNAAQAHVAAKFSVERMARQFEDAYRGLAALPQSQLGWASLLHDLHPYSRLLRLPGVTRAAPA